MWAETVRLVRPESSDAFVTPSLVSNLEAPLRRNCAEGATFALFPWSRSPITAATEHAVASMANTREEVIDRDLRVLRGSAAKPTSCGRSVIIDNQESLIIVEEVGRRNVQIVASEATVDHVVAQISSAFEKNWIFREPQSRTCQALGNAAYVRVPQRSRRQQGS